MVAPAGHVYCTVEPSGQGGPVVVGIAMPTTGGSGQPTSINNQNISKINYLHESMPSLKKNWQSATNIYESKVKYLHKHLVSCSKYKGQTS